MSAFEDAVRRRCGVDSTWQVELEERGGGEFQIGDYTWDSEPHSYVVHVRPLTTRKHRGRCVTLADSTRYAEWQSHEFNDVPAIWDWLAAEV